MSAHLGELFGLLTALCWATGGVLFSRVALPAWALNLSKNVIAGGLLALTVLVSAGLRGGAITTADLSVLQWLIPSAFVGIFLGDTWFLRALQSIGPRKAMVIETLVPPFGLVLGWFVLGEMVGSAGLIGISVTLLGVVVVVGDRPDAPFVTEAPVDGARAGVTYAVLAAAAQAVGAAWSKKGILRLEELGAVDAPLEASAWRVVVAAVLGLAIAGARGRLVPLARSLRRPGLLRVLVPAAVAGTYAGIWCSMLAFRHSTIAVATTLTALTPIFVLPIVAVGLKQRVSARGVAGALIAVIGVVILVRD